MRYRLSTLLLIVAATAALGGWFKAQSDARVAFANTEREFDRMRSGVRIEAEVRRLIELADICDPDYITDDGNPKLAVELTYSMWLLCFYEPDQWPEWYTGGKDGLIDHDEFRDCVERSAATNDGG